MYFQVEKVILWHKSESTRRVLEFAPGKLNVISGASKTGKSAIIPIIDYCLGADKCAIPVGVIREACSWFGILVHTVEGQKLLARKEPGEQRQSGDMFLLEADKVEIPETIEERNTNVSVVKSVLDRVAGLPQLGFDPDSDNAYRSRPSFRDLMAFTFQPQNIIANPNVLFFKADTTEHREKLKTIFPYILNAVTAEVLAARWEIAHLQRNVRRLELEFQAAMSTVDVWRREAQAWLRQAVDLGLRPASAEFPDDWLDMLQTLRDLTSATSRTARPTLDSLDATLVRLEQLRQDETEAATQLSESRQRYNEIRRLQQSSVLYGTALRVQRDRLQLSSWIRDRCEESADAIALLSEKGRQDISQLCTALEGIEMRIRSHPTMSDTLDRERIRLSSTVEQSIERLTRIRQEIALLERESEEAREVVYHSDQIDRFLGRLEQALKLYDRTDENADLRERINSLVGRIAELRQGVSEREIQRRMDYALRAVETYVATIIPKLDAEWPDAPVRLAVNDLTLQVIQGAREDYLWEIGSGANWLAYHVAITLSLHRFFLAQPHHPTPGLLVYDQPSQAYFPRRSVDGDADGEPDWSDEDVIAVQKVFQTFSDETEMAGGRLQIIVLDHAGRDVWGEVSSAELVENWRDGRTLVPENWL